MTPQLANIPLQFDLGSDDSAVYKVLGRVL